MKKVILVGKPNVGKSSIFNFLTKNSQALVDNTPGVTRDRKYGLGHLNGRYYLIVDTGGLTNTKSAIAYQTSVAIQEADLICFVVSIADITYDDFVVREFILKNTKSKILLLINKIDLTRDNYDFFSLGIEDYLTISIKGRINLFRLKSYIFSSILKKDASKARNKCFSFVILGQPNAGKSSLVNSILQEDRMLVSDVPGTTTDTVESFLNYYNHEIEIIDTPGFRKHKHIKTNLDLIINRNALSYIVDATMCVIAIDASLGVNKQDRLLIKLIKDRFCKPVLIAYTKCDLETNNIGFKFTSIKTVKTSTKLLYGIDKLMDLIVEVYRTINYDYSTNSIIKFFEYLFKSKKFPFKIKYAHVGDRKPLTIILHYSYKLSYNRQEQIKKEFFKYFSLLPVPMKIITK